MAALKSRLWPCMKAYKEQRANTTSTEGCPSNTTSILILYFCFSDKAKAHFGREGGFFSPVPFLSCQTLPPHPMQVKDTLNFRNWKGEHGKLQGKGSKDHFCELVPSVETFGTNHHHPPLTFIMQTFLFIQYDQLTVFVGLLKHKLTFLNMAVIVLQAQEWCH